ncbi:MAG: 4'-phosphopantetheinyl transferase superfamily protein [Ruminococcus sp.]|nr:4'-phosphopantetheinyl transferase superfamily protein [Ruminococcus sp.]
MLYTREIDENDGSYAYEHTKAYELLYESVKRETGITVGDGDIAKDGFGKPYFPAHPEVHFSITHCRGLVACLIEDDVCGVDAEAILPVREKAARRVFSEDELKELDKRQGSDREIFFTSLWTLKEAYTKANGRGLAVIKDLHFHSENGRLTSNFPEYRFVICRKGRYIVSVCGRGKLDSINFLEGEDSDGIFRVFS